MLDSSLKYYNSIESMKLLKISACHLSHERAENKIRFVKKGNAFLYLKEDVDMLVKTKFNTLISDHEIVFGIPYFESFLYHRGVVLEQKGEWLFVEYSAKLETSNGYETITHTTHIHKSFVCSK